MKISFEKPNEPHSLQMFPLHVDFLVSCCRLGIGLGLGLGLGVGLGLGLRLRLGVADVVDTTNIFKLSWHHFVLLLFSVAQMKQDDTLNFPESRSNLSNMPRVDMHLTSELFLALGRHHSTLSLTC